MCWQFGKEFQLGKDLLLAKRVRRAGFGKAKEYSFISIFTNIQLIFSAIQDSTPRKHVWQLMKIILIKCCSKRYFVLLPRVKNTKNWYTIDALDGIFAIFTILDTFTKLLQYYYNTLFHPIIPLIHPPSEFHTVEQCLVRSFGSPVKHDRRVVHSLNIGWACVSVVHCCTLSLSLIHI